MPGNEVKKFNDKLDILQHKILDRMQEKVSTMNRKLWDPIIKKQ